MREREREEERGRGENGRSTTPSLVSGRSRAQLIIYVASTRPAGRVDRMRAGRTATPYVLYLEGWHCYCTFEREPHVSRW